MSTAKKAAATKPQSGNEGNTKEFPQPHPQPQMSPEMMAQMQAQQAAMRSQGALDVRKAVALQVFCAHIGSAHSVLHSENIQQIITHSFAAADLFIKEAEAGK